VTRTGDGTPIELSPEDRAIIRADFTRGAVEPLHTTIGRQWARENDEEFCYDHGWQVWMRWNGVVWEEDKTGVALDRMINFTSERRVSMPPRQGAPLGSVGFNRSCLEVAGVSRLMARDRSHFDADPYLMGVPNGYVDLRTGEVHPPDRTKMISMMAMVTPEKGDCPGWLAFLGQAHKGQEEVIGWLQKLCGEALLGMQTSHHFAFFFGLGGNGKSQFLIALTEIMGAYAAQAQEGTFTRPDGKGYRGHAQVLAVLEGKRLVVVSEPDEGEVWDMGRIKQWAGGNSMTADLKFKAARTFAPVGLIVMESNKQLKIETVNNAVARRLRMLVWPHKFDGPGATEGGAVEELGKKLLQKEGPQIFAWMIRGAMRVLEEGLGSTPVITQASNAYMKEQDHDQRFIDDCLVINEHVRPGIDLQDASAVYNQWALLNEAPQRKNIGGRLKDKGLTVSKTDTRRYVRGMELSEEGMTLMSQVLSNRFNDHKLTKGDAGRWADVLRGWRLSGEDQERMSALIGGAHDGDE
jgi:putative DNA primase/helicase